MKHALKQMQYRFAVIYETLSHINTIAWPGSVTKQENKTLGSGKLNLEFVRRKAQNRNQWAESVERDDQAPSRHRNTNLHGY